MHSASTQSKTCIFFRHVVITQPAIQHTCTHISVLRKKVHDTFGLLLICMHFTYNTNTCMYKHTRADQCAHRQLFDHLVDQHCAYHRHSFFPSAAANPHTHTHTYTQTHTSCAYHRHSLTHTRTNTQSNTQKEHVAPHMLYRAPTWWICTMQSIFISITS